MSDLIQKEFKGWRLNLWPVHRHEYKKIIPMGIIMFATIFIYTIVRDTKDTLIVNAAGAGTLTFLKSYFVAPCAILFIISYSYLAHYLTREKLFYVTITPFLIFFGLFGFVFYPCINYLHPSPDTVKALYIMAPSLSGFIDIYAYWMYSLFYIFAEIWGSAIIAVCFWQFANFIIHISDSKRFYGLFAVVGNMSLIFSGPVVMFCSQTIKDYVPNDVDPWGVSLKLLMGLVVLMGITAVYCFRWLHTNVLHEKHYDHYTKYNQKNNDSGLKKKSPGLLDSFKIVLKSKELMLILILILSYNITINIVEIQWKNQLKLFTLGDRGLYNSIMGCSSFVQGCFSIVFGLFIGNQILRKFSWYTAAIITPIILLVGGSIFFSFLLNETLVMAFFHSLTTSPTLIATLIGFIVVSISKPTKYMLFDPTKEMAYIPLSPEEKIKGKVAADVMGARVGKGSGAMIQSWLLMLFVTKDVVLIAPFSLVLFLGIIVAWFYSVKVLSLKVDKNTACAIERESITETVITSSSGTKAQENVA